MKKIIAIMFVLISSFLLISCGDKVDETELTIFYDGEKITWNETSNDINYTVSINNGEETKVTTNYYLYASKVSFDVKVTVNRELDFTTSTSKSFKALKEVENLNFSNDKLTWDLVKDANSYQIEVNNQVVETNYTKLTYEVKNQGSYSFRVKANGPTDEYFSSWSDEFEFKILDIPANVIYDNDTGLIKWRRVIGATKYQVKINNEEFIVDDNEYRHNKNELDFDVQVRALGSDDEKVFASQYSNKESYVFLDMIKEFTVEDGILRWPEVLNADGYLVKVNGGDQKIVLNNYYSDLVQGTSYIIDVKPFNNKANSFSYWAKTEAINILRSPSIKYELKDNESILINWDAINNADGYHMIIKKDGVIVYNEGTTNYSIDYNFRDIGNYEVVVKSTAKGTSNYNDSKYSEKLSIVRLGASKGKTIFDNPLDDVATRITVDNVSRATGFQIELDGLIDYTYNNSERTFLLKTNKENSYEGFNLNIKIRTLGGIERDGTLVLDSIETLNFDVTKLAVPELSILNGDATWTEISSATGYVFDLASKRQELNKVTSHRLDIVEYGLYNISIRAKGNGSNILSSDFSNSVQVRKLRAPKISINNEIAAWEQVDHATSYSGSVSGEQLINSNINVFKLSEYARSEIRYLSLVAKGNGTDILDSEVTVSEGFYRLDNVKGLVATNSEFKWNSVNNALKYEIYINGNSINEEITNVNSFKHNTLLTKAGVYDISIRALGDGKKYFNSTITDQVSVRKLAAPEFDKFNKNTISWIGVSLASQYRVEVSKEDTKNYSVDVLSHTLDLKSAGLHVVRIFAVGNDENIVTSEALEIELNAKKAPKINWTPIFLEDSNSIEMKLDYENYNFIHKEETNFIYNNGRDVITKEHSYIYNEVVGREQLHTVRVEGKFIVLENNVLVYYLESDIESKTIVTYNKPTNIEYTVNRNGKIGAKWEGTSTLAEFSVLVNLTLSDGSVVVVEKNVRGNSIEFTEDNIVSFTIEVFVKAPSSTNTKYYFNSEKEFASFTI